MSNSEYTAVASKYKEWSELELQFKKNACTYANELIGQCKEQELTDEIRLPDNLSDIGRVLGAWGQVLLRGKEWRPDRVAVSGGVMAWVLYMPENDTQPQMVEAWLPFHEQWPIPDTQHDGSIIACGNLSFCDARSVSARKLILRVGLCLDVHVYAQANDSLYEADALPEHVQMQLISRTVMLPAEAGEKSFSLEEQVPYPANSPKLQKLLRYNLIPQIMERRVSGSRVIFRGVAIVHVVGLDGDGQLHSFDTELPFSQYAQLDGQYEEGAEACVWLAVTNLELEHGQEQMLSLKAGLSGQYVIKQQTVLEMVEDAYSPCYELELHRQSLELPAVTKAENMLITARRPSLCDGVRVSDAEFAPGLPELRTTDEGTELLLTGRFTILYYDRQQQLQSMTVKWEQEQEAPCEKGMQLRCFAVPGGKAEASLTEVGGQLLLDFSCICTEPMEMVASITVGEEKTAEENRPAIVVCRAGDEGLWKLAKKAGSTVAAIRAMNELSDEPEPNQMLLIPII